MYKGKTEGRKVVEFVEVVEVVKVVEVLEVVEVIKVVEHCVPHCSLMMVCGIVH